MDSPRDRLLRILVETGSFRFSETPFALASGAMSNYYVDCKVGLSHARMREIVGQLIMERIAGLDVGAVGGLLIGAYPIAIAVSDADSKTGKEIRAFAVRKDPKKHGTKKLLEGDVQAGDRVVIVDDVITSGGSTIEAIQKSREAGLQVVKAVAIIDRQEQNGRKNIEAEGIPFEALCTLDELQAMREVLSHREG